MAGYLNKIANVRLDEELATWLERKAAQQGDRNVSTVIRNLLREAKLREQEKVPA